MVDDVTCPAFPFPKLNGSPLVIGITGPTKLHESRTSLEASVEPILDDLYAPIEEQRSLPIRWLQAKLDAYWPVNRKYPGKCFRHPMGLKKTPLMILSSLAPGSDTIIVDIIEKWAQRRGVEVECVSPLPFPLGVYEQVSSSLSGSQPLSEFKAALSSARSFIVRHGTESHLNDEAMAEKLLRDCQGDEPEKRANRNERYLLAAGFVANFCDVLLAFADDQDLRDAQKPTPFLLKERPAGAPAPSLTSRCMGMKLSGVGLADLPLTPAFAWVDQGPVICIPIQRTPPSEGLAVAGKAEPHYSIDSRLVNDARGESLLRAMCEELEAFNAASAKIGPVPTAEELPKICRVLRPFLREATFPEEITFAQFCATWQQFTPGLRDLAILETRRRRASTLQGPAKKTEDDLQSWLFGAIFAVAFFIHIYENLDFVGNWVLLVLAALFAVSAWIRYRGFVDSRQEDHGQDWRAIAEGMRVQFFWAAAGLPISAAGNYLERMRSELDWLRNTLSAWSLPYSRWRIAFEELSLADQLHRLRTVREAWVKEQQTFFQGEAIKAEKRKERFHHFGIGLIQSAVPVVILMGCLDIWKTVEHLEGKDVEFHGPLEVALSISLGLFLLVGGLLLAYSEKSLFSEHGRQYRAMHALMEAAGRRLDDLFAEAETQINDGSDEARLYLKEIIAEIQRLLLEIGKQALDENAEWLLLHRSRPVEIPSVG